MSQFDVLCIGNAIVDIIARCDDAFLDDNNIIKAAMNLIDTERAELLYVAMGPAIETSGGSAGNTAAGVASLGGRAAFFGKVSEDQLGKIYTHDIRAQGVHFETRPLKDAPPTARSMIFVTPDGERSMNTYLGACVELGPDDIEDDVVAGARVTYFEGYLWDPPLAKDAIRMAAKIAHDNGREVSMTLSDPFCVGRYRAEFLDLMRSGTIDIVFANSDEAKSLYETADFDEAATRLAADCKLAIVTRSEHGSVVLCGQERIEIPAIEVTEVVDTTGAGDLYAAGFLFGYATGRPLETCGRLGSLAAGLVIQQIGPRLQLSLQEAAEDAGLI
ncbi:sugar/nucleoside kinase (ribokinase family) [Hoeflea marina]|uniref:Sugar/nucleoside kinase (Ribokinase family) n=1 Tax=Hoeflea marina TaxID=274592 RepID=A0A317PNL8_9HYPH|nr:adenosine kinase [Hoeflea marina]PWW00091.1 sugar/nucleoside kinase (ribokinase family) [Hoeflea marina]